jgi:hypothetical protein
MVGYFTIDSHMQQGYIDWDWLRAQNPEEKKSFTRLLHFKNPVIIKMNRNKNKGIILKPENFNNQK